MGLLLGTTMGPKRWDYSVTCQRLPTTKEPIPTLIRATRKRKGSPFHLSFCKGGKGIHPGAGHENGACHGPFDTLDDARAAAARTGGQVSRCKFCLP